MKILRHKAHHAGFYISDSWKKTAEYCGFEFKIWDEKQEPAEDVFKEYQPDIYLADVGNLNEEIINANLKYGHQTVLAVHHYPYNKNNYIPTLKEDGYYTVPNHVELAKKLNPEYVYNQAFPSALNKYWDGWKKEGFKLESIPYGGDILKYWPEDGVEKDINWSYIGDFWPRKSCPGIFSYVYPLIYTFTGVIVGDCWPNYFGNIPKTVTEEDFRVITSRSRIVPHMHEPDCRIYGAAITERVFKAPLCGTVGITDGNPSVYDISSNMLSYSDPDIFYDKAKELIANPHQEDLQIVKDVLCNHTYFNRLWSLMESLGWTTEADIVSQKRRDAIKEWCNKSELGQKMDINCENPKT